MKMTMLITMRMKMAKVYEEIYDYVKTLEIIDTHEHLPPFEHLRDKDTDVLREYLAHYLSCDLVSAGFFQKSSPAEIPWAQGSL